MIDEKKLIEDIKSLSKNLYGCDVTNEKDLISFKENEHDHSLIYSVEGIEDVLEMIKAQPKVGEWISVEEGLPKVGQDILATCSNGEVDAGFYGWNGDWNLDYIDIEAHPVIAWMPFPEPYKEKNNEI